MGGNTEHLAHFGRGWLLPGRGGKHWGDGRQMQILHSWGIWATDWCSNQSVFIFRALFLQLQNNVQMSFHVKVSTYCSNETLEQLEKEELLYPSWVSLISPSYWNENVRLKILMQSKKRIKSGSTPFASFSGKNRVQAFPITSPKWLKLPQGLSTHCLAGLEWGLPHSCRRHPVQDLFWSPWKDRKDGDNVPILRYTNTAKLLLLKQKLRPRLPVAT